MLTSVSALCVTPHVTVSYIHLNTPKDYDNLFATNPPCSLQIYHQIDGLMEQVHDLNFEPLAVVATTTTGNKRKRTGALTTP